MSTGLSAQLQRLEAPQTSRLVESKSTASIIYPPKEAALIDRQTIFNKSKSGLQELINLNATFSQFQRTLFDATTINLERSVETQKVNETLNKNIRKFLLQLSPHFMVTAAHHCLEWLIRRYRINEYNVDDLMGLILPFHETNMFVKCLQTIPFTDRKSPWYWMKAIRKARVTLSKQLVIKRAATDCFFLEFISKTTLAAVNELKSKAHSLQALFAFYLTTTLGALNAAKEIDNSHVSNIVDTLSKGLSSDVVDFRAASMLITSFMLTKIELSKVFLKNFIEKLTNITPQELRKESIVSLLVICQTQTEGTELVVETVLSKIHLYNTSITTILGSLHKDNVDVLSLCLPLITKCVEQNESKNTGYQTFVETLLSELTLNNDDANAVIRCFLNASKHFSQSEVVLELSDDDDDVEMSDANGVKVPWHSSMMRTLETRYPEVFDAVKTDIMSSQDEESSALKMVLAAPNLLTVSGSLLCSTYNAHQSDASLFVDLHHPSVINRMKAVENLVKANKLSTMPFSDDKKNLLAAGIALRLNDSSPDVVNEVLKFSTQDLIKTVGEQNLVKKLKFIIGDQWMMRKKWHAPIHSAIRHITSSELVSESNEIEIFLAIWPYMFPLNDRISIHTRAIKKSCIASRFPIIAKLQDKGNNTMEGVNKLLRNSFERSDIEAIIQFVKAVPPAEMSQMSAFHIINLLTHSLPKNSDHKLSTGVFEIATTFSTQFKWTLVDIDQYAQDLYSRNQPEHLPVQVQVNCIQSIIENTNFSAILKLKLIDFTIKSDELLLILRLHKSLSSGLLSKSNKMASVYSKAMSELIRRISPKMDKRLDLFSNFFIAHYIDLLPELWNSFRIDPELQLLSMRLFNEILKHTDSLTEISMEVFIRIISGLTSPLEIIRKLTCDTIDALHKSLDKSSQFSKFLGLLKEEREKVSLSSTELTLFLFNTKQKRTISDLFEYIYRPDSSMILKASLLDMLKFVTDDKYLDKEKVVAVALNILQKSDSAQQICLNPYESIVVYQTIIRFEKDTIIASISAPGICKTFFEKVLQHSHIFVQIDNKQESISVTAMNLNVFKNFEKFPSAQKKFIINSIVKSATFAKTDDVRSRASKFFKQKSIVLDGKNELDILTEMAKVTSLAIDRQQQVKCLSQELLQTSAWKCGVTLLEFLHKKQLRNPLDLVRQLFPVLRKCLDFDDQSLVEYTKQLALSDILHCCELISTPIQQSDFNIDLVVHCVRGTQNPQTHHHALQLLTKLATMLPEAVLHHIMEIFTFVGTTVARRDDAYIFQLISNIIKSVVPILKQKNTIQVMKAFSDMILDVPNHRRSALYEDFLTTLDPKVYLWQFLAILFETDVRNQLDNTKPYFKRTHIAIEITNLFDCDIIMETCYQLIKFSRSQLSATDKSSTIDDNCKEIFNAEHHARDESILYINLILNFVNVLTLDKSQFSKKMTSLDREELLKHKETFKNIIPAILKYIKAFSRSSIRSIGKSSGDGLSACYHILDHLLDLLYPDMLLQVVKALLKEKYEIEVRRKIVDLLNKKLDSPELFADCKDSILDLLEPLSSIAFTIAEKPANSSLQEDALVAIQLLSRIIAKDHPTRFAGVLQVLSKILQSYKDLTVRLSAYLIQCLGELCANLRIHSISHLHRFMPSITEVLNDLMTSQSDAVSPCFEIILTAISRIVDTVALFLTPFLSNLITSLSILWSRLQITSSNDSQKSLLKLDEIWQKLASTLELRVLIPMVEKHIYPALLDRGKYNATGPLMVLLLESFGHSESADLVQNCQDLTSFFIGVMDFRSKYHHACTTVDVQEEFFIKTLVGFVLKLSEGSFRPFYNKLFEWSNENRAESYDRSITFYRVSNKLAESLKSLYSTFASPLVQNSADLLSRNFTKTKITASAKPVYLISHILSTLQNVFLYCTSFVNANRFNVLLGPLVNLLDHEEYLADKNISESLPKCLAQFAMAANNDLLWKQLNHQILMKTRSNSVVVRRWALTCSVEVVIQLGEDSTQLYPELIPFFSELKEDEDPEIQKILNRSVLEIEKVTGEELRKHL